jgi:hypothetical protein
MRAKIILASLAAVLAAAPARAGAGLKTQFGDVVVKGLKIGQTYSLSKLVNLPLRLVNTGDSEVEVVITPIIPSAAVLRDGYEPVPSADWVRVESSSLLIGANREGATDVIVSIPNDPKLLGKRIQADIWSHTRDPMAPVAVGIQSHLLIHVDSEPPTEDELKKKFVDETLANLDFSVMPMSVDLGVLPAGKAHELRKERKLALKLINPNDHAVTFRVKPLPVWESLILPPPGTAAALDANWLKPAKEVVKVEASSIGEVSLTLTVPDDAKTRGRRFMLLLAVEVLEQKIPTKVYSKYFVTVPATEKAEGETR